MAITPMGLMGLTLIKSQPQIVASSKSESIDCEYGRTNSISRTAFKTYSQIKVSAFREPVGTGG
jgi:hypothetical protein